MNLIRMQLENDRKSCCIIWKSRDINQLSLSELKIVLAVFKFRKRSHLPAAGDLLCNTIWSQFGELAGVSGMHLQDYQHNNLLEIFSRHRRISDKWLDEL